MKIFSFNLYKRLHVGSFALALALFSIAGVVRAEEKSAVTSRGVGAQNLLRSTSPENIQAAKQFIVDTMKASGTRRARAVGIDFSVLQTVRRLVPFTDQPIAMPESATPPGAVPIRMDFFDDVPILLEITSMVPTPSGGYGYIGRVSGIADSMVVIVDNDSAVSMNVSAGSKRFVINGTTKSGYVARELGQLPSSDHGTLTPREINAPPLLKKLSTASANDAPEVAADTGNQIDVMVVYTPYARNAYGGTAQVQAAIDAQILLINQVYANSNVVQRLRLVYKGEVNHVEASPSDRDLDRLAIPGDGILDEVPVLRNLYQADAVSLWGNYPDVCGIGFIMATESSGFAPNAYNIVNSPSCTNANSYTMAHELGHNMGLRHDNYVDPNPNTTVTPEGSAIASIVTYAHGYVDLTNRFRTVMSYNDQCQASGFNCTRIAHFSNPLVNYNNNLSYGPAVLATTGNAASSHESRALNDTRETFANFRQGLATLTGPGIVAFSLPTYTASEGGGSVTITVGRHVGSTGAISVSFATSNGTATAGSDFVADTNTLSWANGDSSSKTIVINILQDGIVEGTETFSINLSNPTGGASIGSAGGINATATVRINDDDADPALANCAFSAGFITPPIAFVPTPSATAGWAPATDRLRSGTCSLKSAAIGNNAAAQTQVKGTFNSGNISFYHNVSSEPDWDCLRFFVDDVERAEMGSCVNSGGFGASGEASTTWTFVSVPVSAGEHTFVWSYEKDSSQFLGADAAWIDDVVLPPLATATLTVAKAGTGTGTVTGNGFNCGADCSENVVIGRFTSLSAVANSGSIFTGWSGGGCSGTGSCGVTVTAAATVTANFALQQVNLSVVLSGTGSGAVASVPGGISCGVTCTSAYTVGTMVTLTATPTSGSTFSGWSGSGCSGAGICVVTVSTATTVTATFNASVPDAPSLNAVVPGNAQASVNFTAPASNGGSPITGYTANCGGVLGSGAFSPIVVSPLVNNMSYSCFVTATNAVGTSAPSGSLMVMPTSGAALALAGVFSRKNHPGIGDQDIQIDTGPLINGLVTVEPRIIGAGHQIVFLFNNTVTAVASSATTLGSASHVINGTNTSEVIVTLTGVADNRRATVSLSGAAGVIGTLNPAASMGFLVGDVNGSRSVNASDISAVKAHNGQNASSLNYRYDLNVTGGINGTDVSAVKARSGLVIP